MTSQADNQLFQANLISTLLQFPDGYMEKEAIAYIENEGIEYDSSKPAFPQAAMSVVHDFIASLEGMEQDTDDIINTL